MAPLVGQRVTLSEPARWQYGEYVLDIRTRDGYEAGQISYRNVDHRRGRAELGIELYPAHRRRGYGTEAIRLLLEELLLRQGFHTIYLRVREYNQPARRTYEKVGFRYVRTVRWPIIGIVRYMVMEITATELNAPPGPG